VVIYHIASMYRIVNLELMSQYGSDAWKLSNSVLQQMLETARKQLIDLKLVLLAVVAVNPLDSKGNYSPTLNNTKLVHWPLMGGLLHLVQ